MTQENINLRNKYVKKINRDVEKLTNNINLLMQVDKSLYNLSGGAPPNGTEIAKAIGYVHQFGVLNSLAGNLTVNLAKNIKTLEDTLNSLLNSIKKVQVDENTLENIKTLERLNINNTLNFKDTDVTIFNELLSKYAKDYEFDEDDRTKYNDLSEDFKNQLIEEIKKINTNFDVTTLLT